MTEASQGVNEDHIFNSEGTSHAVDIGGEALMAGGMGGLMLLHRRDKKKAEAILNEMGYFVSGSQLFKVDLPASTEVASDQADQPAETDQNSDAPDKQEEAPPRRLL